jgi:hypothetical protein
LETLFPNHNACTFMRLFWIGKLLLIHTQDMDPNGFTLPF